MEPLSYQEKGLVQLSQGLRDQFDQSVFLAPTRNSTLLIQTKRQWEETLEVIKSLTTEENNEKFYNFISSEVREVPINELNQFLIPDHLLTHLGDKGEFKFDVSISLNRT